MASKRKGFHGERSIRVYLSKEDREFYSLCLQTAVEQHPWNEDSRKTIWRLSRPDKYDRVLLTDKDVYNLLRVGEDIADATEYYGGYGVVPISGTHYPWKGSSSTPKYPESRVARRSRIRGEAKRLVRENPEAVSLLSGQSSNSTLSGAVMDELSSQALVSRYDWWPLRNAIDEEVARKKGEG